MQRLVLCYLKLLFISKGLLVLMQYQPAMTFVHLNFSDSYSLPSPRIKFISFFLLLLEKVAKPDEARVGDEAFPATLVKPTTNMKPIFKIFLLFFLLLCKSFPVFAQQTTPAFRNASLPMETRVTDLLQQLTLEEKISLLGFRNQAINRLNKRLVSGEINVYEYRRQVALLGQPGH